MNNKFPFTFLTYLYTLSKSLKNHINYIKSLNYYNSYIERNSTEDLTFGFC